MIKKLYREIKSGAFSMQVADCDRNIRIQFEKLQQENKQLKERINKSIEYINSQSPDAGVSGKHIKEILRGEINEIK